MSWFGHRTHALEHLQLHDLTSNVLFYIVVVASFFLSACPVAPKVVGIPKYNNNNHGNKEKCLPEVECNQSPLVCLLFA